MPRRLPSSATVTVIYNGVPRQVLYRPGDSVYRLLPEATRAHGLRFAQHPNLRLHDADGQQLHHINAAKRAGITPNCTLTLKTPGT